MHVGTAEGARAVVLPRVPYLGAQVNEDPKAGCGVCSSRKTGDAGDAEATSHSTYFRLTQSNVDRDSGSRSERPGQTA